MESEMRELPLTADEVAGDMFAAELSDALEERSYERVFQVVRGLHSQMIVLQRYPDDRDDEVITEVFWTGSLSETELLLAAFAKYCHAFNPKVCFQLSSNSHCGYFILNLLYLI
jgi:hypothetical protein